MAHYEAPRINTNRHQQEQQEDTATLQLQNQLNAYSVVPVTPVYEHVGGIHSPGVPYNYGWALPLMQNQIMSLAHAWGAPSIQRYSLSDKSLFSQAANPTPQTAQTGVHGPLRAPGINEGY